MQKEKAGGEILSFPPHGNRIALTSLGHGGLEENCFGLTATIFNHPPVSRKATIVSYVRVESTLM